MSRDAPRFEVLRFEAVPAPGGVAILELQGEFAHDPPRRTRLLVERGRGSVEVPAITVLHDPWTATFAIALDDLADRRTEYALAPDRGALIALPAPGGPGEEDRYVRMARTANDLRHRATVAAQAAAAAEARLAEAERERDGAVAELEAERSELAAARARAGDAERIAAEAAERVAAAERAAAGARDELDASRETTRQAAQRATEAERDVAAQRARAEAAEADAADLREAVSDERGRADDLDTRLVAAEDEVRATRRELRDTRARLEALLRDRRGAGAAHPLRHADDVEPDEPEPGEAAPEGEAASEEDDTRPMPAQAGGGEDETARFESPPARAVATRPRRSDRIGPGGELDDVDEDAGASGGDADVLDPAAVGARHIERSQTRSPHLTRERIVVGGALLVLVVVLLLILLGVG